MGAGDRQVGMAQLLLNYVHQDASGAGGRIHVVKGLQPRPLLAQLHILDPLSVLLGLVGGPPDACTGRPVLSGGLHGGAEIEQLQWRIIRDQRT